MKKQTEQVERKSHGFLWTTLIILAVISTILIIVLPTTTITCYQTVQEQTQVPYEATEQYWDTVPVTKTDCNDENLAYNIEWSTSSYCSDSNWYGTCAKYTKQCALTIKNLDNEGGTFKFTGYAKDENGGELSNQEKNVWVQPQLTQRITWSYTYLPHETITCYYKGFYPGTKNVCKDYLSTEQVLKTRTVTKYRTEMKDVVKPYTKEVNWAYGRC